MIASAMSPHAVSMLAAVLALAAWTGIVMLWMYSTRLPAMRRAGLPPQSAAHVADLRGRLPSSTQRVADNYNHLMEAPTVFYAATIASVLLGAADTTNVWAAWSYVGLRIVHSVVQGTFNRVELRFVLFSASWLALGVMIIRSLATVSL